MLIHLEMMRAGYSNVGTK